MRIRLFRVKENGYACYMSCDGKMQLGVRDDHPNFSKLPLYVDVRIELREARAAFVMPELRLAA